MPPSIPPAWIGSPPGRHLEPLADLHRLDRGNAEEGLAEQAVEAAVPVDVAPQADGHVVGQDLDHAAEGITVACGRLDLFDHGRLRLGVEAAHGRRVDAFQVGRSGTSGGQRDDRPEGHDVGKDLDVEARQQGLGHRAGGHPGRRLARRGPLQHVARVGQAVLLHPGQVGVPGTGAGEGLLRLPRCGVHLLLPLGPLGVGDLDGHGRAESAAVADTAEQGQLVTFEAHARATAVPQTPPGQLALDLLDGDVEAGGEALDDDDEGFAVGFAGGEESEHGANLRRGA